MYSSAGFKGKLPEQDVNKSGIGLPMLLPTNSKLGADCLYSLILFDLDGTLTDPKAGITRCVQYALHKLGIEEPNLDTLIHFIGPPLMKNFQQTYGLSEEDAACAVGYYRERFIDVGMYENAVFSGVPEMLAELKRQGKELVVATSKPTVYSVQILEHFKLSRYFSKIVGSNLDGTRVEKSEVIEFALAEIGDYDKRSMVMVGDRMHDIRGAARNGLDSVAVTFGYGSMEELEQAKPTYMVASIDELMTVIGK